LNFIQIPGNFTFPSWQPPNIQTPDFITPFLPFLVPIILLIVYFKFGAGFGIGAGLLLAIFGPIYFKDFMNQTVLSFPFLVITTLTLTVWITFFMIIHKFSGIYEGMTSVLGPFWSFVLILTCGIFLGAVIGAYYPNWFEGVINYFLLKKG